MGLNDRPLPLPLTLAHLSQWDRLPTFLLRSLYTTDQMHKLVLDMLEKSLDVERHTQLLCSGSKWVGLLSGTTLFKAVIIEEHGCKKNERDRRRGARTEIGDIVLE